MPMQVGGVFKLSGSPHDDEHRDFEDWCTLGWEIDKIIKDFGDNGNIGK